VTEQDLLDAGYRKVTVDDPADRGYERKITQDEGPLYNILVLVYESRLYGGVGMTFRVFFNGHDTLYMEANLHNAQKLTVEKAEQWCDRMYAACTETKP